MLSSEREALEEEIVDAATAAHTAEELRHEINVLEDLVRLAQRVRHSGTDVKWQQLSRLLTDTPEMFGGHQRHKIIIFTEHRDTLTIWSARSPTCSESRVLSSPSTAGSPVRSGSPSRTRSARIPRSRCWSPRTRRARA